MRTLLVCLLALFNIQASAENWQQIDTGFAFDTDSLSQVKDDGSEWEATWRISRYGRTTTTTGRLQCGLEMVSPLRSFANWDDPVMAKLGGTAIDYLSRTQQQGSKPPSPLSEQDTRAANQFPTPSSSEGKLLARLCQFDQGPKIKAVKELLRRGCKEGSAAYLCRMTDADFLEYANLVSRIQLAEYACNMGRERLSSISYGWLRALARCQDSAGGCRGLLSLQVSGVSQDLSAAMQGGTCAYLAGAQAQIDADEAKNAAWDTYRKCVSAKIITLDDGRSPADVIARGVFAQCRSQSPVSNMYEPGQSVIDLLTGRILEERQARRTSPKSRSAPKVEG